MKSNEIIIRKESPADWAEVENLTREAFWDVYAPGCDEHLIVHDLHGHKNCIEELTYVAEYNGRIVGHIMYTHSHLSDGTVRHPSISFGPISVLPDMQRKGVGSLLIRHTLALAKEMGYPGVIIEGNPNYYHRFGFYDAEKHGIAMPDGTFSDCMMAIEFIPGALHAGTACYADAFNVDQARLTEFEKQFPPKVKRAAKSTDLHSVEPT